jgi:hypothetical protein
MTTGKQFSETSPELPDKACPASARRACAAHLLLQQRRYSLS